MLLLDWCESDGPRHLMVSKATGCENSSAAFIVRFRPFVLPKFPIHPQSVVAGSSSGELRISSMLRDLRPCSRFLVLLILPGVEVLWRICTPGPPDPFFGDLSSWSARHAEDERV